jgi:hypothetical protein
LQFEIELPAVELLECCGAVVVIVICERERERGGKKES